ncbi:E3 ubiquitin-protein ligase MIB2-like [Gigantopelta aegis]|uniref:E3 ubiquitin-protein ligase MIB2-like n=1 Tax=Gigantopelta aegis TaxID=1735272 RepID=UPI001B88DB36|nr:E3 ubiquitin-protein ligase MIB2-like [Gigantopelta aegis]
MAAGLRVIRGRDWLSGDVDGGEGHLGTVVSYGKDETAEVIWDNGKQAVSSIGKDSKYELRLVDNAPVGVFHQTVTCGGCGEIGKVCDRAREIANREKIELEDCGLGKEGTVVVVLSFHSTSHRSAVSVAWDSGETTTCRVGHQGQVDVQCVREALGPDIYAEHLPLLDLAGVRAEVHLTSQAEGGNLQGAIVPKLKKGATVRILDDKDKVKELQDGHGEWIDPMEEPYESSDEEDSDPYESSDEEDSDPLGLLKTLAKTLEQQTQLLGLLGSDEEGELMSLKGEGSNEFLQAINDSDVEKVKKVLERFPKLVTAQPDNGITCLHIAANDGKLDIVKFLVEKGFDVNAKDLSGNTAFLKALKKKHVDVSRFLLEADTDLEISNDDGQSAMHCAVYAGDASLVRDLIMRACDVNVVDNSGDTPLHDAIGQNETTCAEMILMSPNLDLTIDNEKGFNPLQWAALHGTFGGTLVEKTILRNKSLIDVKMEAGFAPLHIAVINDHTEAAQILIKQCHGLRFMTGKSSPYLGQVKCSQCIIRQLHVKSL